MADPVSLGLAISQAIVTAVHIGRITKGFIDDARRAPDEINTIASEIADVELVLRRLHPIILKDAETMESEPGVRLEGIADLATIVISTTINISKLSKTIIDLQDGKSSTILNKVKWAYHKSHLLEIVEQLQHTKSSLHLILAVLQW